MNTQEFYDIVDSAFSDFFVADMDSRRCDTYGAPIDEACYYARRNGARMGAITVAVCRNAGLLKAALGVYQANGLEGSATDPLEGVTMEKNQVLPYLVLKYQLDDNRPEVVKAFLNACVDTMRKALKE